MATKRTGLGRGIGALIPVSDDTRSRPVDVFFPDQVGAANAEDELLQVPGARLAQLSLSEIVPNAAQPRSVFDQDELAELVHSIREFGVLQPIVVRPVTGRKGAKYELVMGERRFRASKAAGLKTIPAVVKDTADENMLRDALLENLHRAELNPLEEASAYQQLLSDFGITQEALATRLGRSRPQISNTLRLLRLPADVQARVAAGVLSAGHARAVLSVETPELMRRLADKIVNEDLSVRAAEAAAAQMKAPKTTSREPEEEQGGHAGHLSTVADHLGDRLNTRVKVTLGARKGQVVIDFATIHDLNRILAEIGEPTEVSLAP
ncbi:MULTISPECIES: ParB/RepB/Spo0J family partition protein [unclassified Rathayibacter]|uniref:ParB/RepB/Spo0J family partition protein n=1 Tax=unclassified Rathayibacter TaxID=2609250 RepID=UPI001FB39C82|nr:MULTISPECIES: ParB/RepB/Spo0J family partition protein [unclassified Rathayibacter]MCJ1673607.1 ParB/RepB/Spo0J family partition protein [Rathayibacter sp. VKM Ac-2929]MCJ1683395.1 ParB/RepB/Spo0J family partition protein [Rathayibacter sp. VKM Ac-2928]